MKQRVKSGFFIGYLDRFGRRRSRTGAAIVRRQAPAMWLASGLRYENRREVARLTRTGENAQSVRCAAELERVGQEIQDIALDPGDRWVGKYYCALAMNRRGPEGYPEANEILEQVADWATGIYRAKARVALATNVVWTGDHKGARSLYREAAQMTRSFQHGTLSAAVSIRFQTAIIKHLEGDHDGALRQLEDMRPLAWQIAREHPALWHSYCNGLAVTLAACGRLDEARHYSNIVRHSPFAGAYPEWGRTCAALDLIKAQQLSRSTIYVGHKDFTVAEMQAGPESVEPVTSAVQPAGLRRTPHSPDPDLYTAVDAPDADPQPDFDSDLDHAPVEAESSFPVQIEAALTDASGNRPVAAASRARAAFLCLRLMSERATVRKRHRAGREPFKSPLFANREVTSPRANRSERQCHLLALGGWVPSARAPPAFPV
jgi:hypothetical protein